MKIKNPDTKKGSPNGTALYAFQIREGLETEADADDASVTAAIVFILGALIFSRDVGVAVDGIFQTTAETNAFQREAEVAVRRFEAGAGVANLAERQNLRGQDVAQTDRSGQVAAYFRTGASTVLSPSVTSGPKVTFGVRAMS